jgi:hypothetical protein
MKSLADGLPAEIVRQIDPEWRQDEAPYWAVRDQLLSRYEGQWIGFAGGAVVASGSSPVAVFHAAEAMGRSPFVTCVGRENEAVRMRRASFAYDGSYPEGGPYPGLPEVESAARPPAAGLACWVPEVTMDKHGKTWLRPAVVALLATCGLGVVANAQPEPKAAPKALSPQVVKAWRAAGFALGWMKDLPPQSDTWGLWQPWREKGEAGAIPAFSSPIGEDVRGVLSKLPDPGTAFGLDFHCGSDAGVTLKEFAKLTNLQSLNIGAVRSGHRRKAYEDLKDLAGLTNLRALYLFYMPVTDADLKHIAGLKHLQVLDLSATKVSGAGIKALAGLKDLRWLNLSTPGVTADAMAALQKELPKCKIVTYDD